MNKLLQEQSPLRQFLTDLFDDFLYSTLTLFCSLPVVTTGAAFTALLDMTIQNIDSSHTTIRDYFRSFRINFRRSTICWTIWILLVSLFFLGARYNTKHNSQLRIPLWGLLLFLNWILLFIAIYLPPFILAKPDAPLSDLWRNAFFTSIALLPRTFLILFINSVPLLFYILMPDIFWIISFIWLFFWPSIAIRLSFPLIRPFFPEFNRDTD